jgi:exodeoxyribonuclease V alpha subunit
MKICENRCKSLHRLLEINPKGGGFSRTAERPLSCDLLVVDESSMIDVPLMNALLKAIPKTSAIFL